MAGKFEVYQDKAGKYRWRLKARNGQLVASGEDYDTQAAAVRGVRAAQRSAEGAEIYSEVQAGGSGAERRVTRVNSASKLIKIEDT